MKIFGNEITKRKVGNVVEQGINILIIASGFVLVVGATLSALGTETNLISTGLKGLGCGAGLRLVYDITPKIITSVKETKPNVKAK